MLQVTMINLNIILIKQLLLLQVASLCEWDKVITVSNDLRTSLFHN
jgi:hypothetical protein